jgi:hypothetical protein
MPVPAVDVENTDFHLLRMNKFLKKRPRSPVREEMEAGEKPQMQQDWSKLYGGSLEEVETRKG